jgi:hypothetical protein
MANDSNQPNSVVANFEAMKQLVEPELQNFVKGTSRLPKHLQLKGGTNQNPSNVSDVLAIATIEEEFEQINNEIIKTKNRCSVSEYANKWAFLHLLFEHSGCKTKHEFKQRRAQLSSEYLNRFSTQHPIVIFEDRNPNHVIAIMPPMYRQVQPLRGGANGAIDSFISYGVCDRPDVEQAANFNLVRAGVEAQQTTKEALKMMQAQTNDAIIKVLQCFEPNHPLLQKMQTAKQTQPAATPTTTGATPVVADKNTITDLDPDDFGF